MPVDKKDFTNNKYKAVADRWGESREKVKSFMLDISRKNMTFRGVGGPRPIVVRDRNHHTTGDNLMLVPAAEEIAHKIFIEKYK